MPRSSKVTAFGPKDVRHGLKSHTPMPNAARPCPAKSSTRLKGHPSENGPGLEPRDRDENDYQLHRRYDRFARLVGEPGIERLLASHVMVIGLGGVGGPATESLVRSGVGRITLVDFDRVCVTNTNRQVQALKGNIGPFESRKRSQNDCDSSTRKQESMPSASSTVPPRLKDSWRYTLIT